MVDTLCVLCRVGVTRFVENRYVANSVPVIIQLILFDMLNVTVFCRLRAVDLQKSELYTLTSRRLLVQK